MNKLFNTPFEIGLRILVLLNTLSDISFTLDRIYLYDFITSYAKTFNIDTKNLHGDNWLNFSQLANRRELCVAGLKLMGLNGFISMKNQKSGFKYKISKKGSKYIKTLDIEYTKDYINICKEVHSKYKNKTDSNLIREINELAINNIRR